MKLPKINAAIIVFIAFVAMFLLGGGKFFSIIGGANDGTNMVALDKQIYNYGEKMTVNINTGDWGDIQTGERYVGMFYYGNVYPSDYMWHVGTVDAYKIQLAIDGVEYSSFTPHAMKAIREVAPDVAGPISSKMYSLSCPKTSYCVGGGYECMQLCVYQNQFTIPDRYDVARGTKPAPSKELVAKTKQTIAQLQFDQYLTEGEHTLDITWYGDNVYGGGNNPYLNEIYGPRNSDERWQTMLLYEKTHRLVYTASIKFNVSNSTTPITCASNNTIGGMCIIETTDTCKPGQNRVGMSCQYNTTQPHMEVLVNTVFMEVEKIVYQDKIVTVNETIYIDRNNTEYVDRPVETIVKEISPIGIIAGLLVGGLVVFGSMKLLGKKKR